MSGSSSSSSSSEGSTLVGANKLAEDNENVDNLSIAAMNKGWYYGGTIQNQMEGSQWPEGYDQAHAQYGAEATGTHHGSVYEDSQHPAGSVQGSHVPCNGETANLQQNDQNSVAHYTEFRKSVMFEQAQDPHNTSSLHPFSTKVCMIILSVASCLLILSLLVSCIAFAVDVIRLKSMMSSVNQEFSARLQTLNDRLSLLEADFVETLDGRSQNYPILSCAFLARTAPSGYYWIRTSNGSVVQLYCNVSLMCGNTTGGWMKLFELDMTNSTHHCPEGLQEQSANGSRTCVRTIREGCSSVTLLTYSLNYTAVCGRVRAYQYGFTNAFTATSIEETFVDGVTFSHGHPRTHIWTFVNAFDETRRFSSGGYCICISRQPDLVPHDILPPFLDEDYFCDTGTESQDGVATWFTQDPLWDGAGCGQFSTCCSFGNPPWFYKQLPRLTTDDIEMRVCMNERPENEDVGIEAVDVYVM